MSRANRQQHRFPGSIHFSLRIYGAVIASFSGMAFAAAVLAFIGFAPTYFLKAWYGTPALPAVVHVHGLLMTWWLVLLIVQTSSVAARRTDLRSQLTTEERSSHQVKDETVAPHQDSSRER